MGKRRSIGLEERAFFRACAEEAAATLIYADWLEDQGRCGEAAAIRHGWLFERGFSDSSGSGSGDGYGNGYGYGDGNGYGNGDGNGDGNGYGNGYVNSYGDGYGYGSGYGYGDGYGSEG